MKSHLSGKIIWTKAYTIIFFNCFLLFNAISVKSFANSTEKACLKNYFDSTKESKVDFLERIYFSGKNRDGLNTMILETLQDFEGKNTTASVAVQYTFLSNIKTNAANADDACQIEDMLAAGIYNIDAREAETQKIPLPSKETNARMAPALDAASNASRSFGNAAITSYYLSNGNIGMGRAGITAYRFGAAAGAASQTVNGINQAKEFFKGISRSKDKPCKNVSPKDIEVGSHLLSAGNEKDKILSSKTESINVSITNVTFDQSKSIKSNINKIKNVLTIKNNSFNSNSVSMLIVTNLPVNLLTDSIMIVNKEITFEVISQSGDEDQYKQVTLSINADASADPAEKKYRKVSVTIMGLTYEQYKLVADQLGKKTGIKSVKANGYASTYTILSLNSSLSADDLIDDIKNIFPKVHFEVGAATDEAIMLTRTENN